MDRVHVAYSRTDARGKKFTEDLGIPKYTTDMAEAINDPETDLVVIGLDKPHLQPFYGSYPALVFYAKASDV